MRLDTVKIRGRLVTLRDAAAAFQVPADEINHTVLEFRPAKEGSGFDLHYETRYGHRVPGSLNDETGIVEMADGTKIGTTAVEERPEPAVAAAEPEPDKARRWPPGESPIEKYHAKKRAEREAGA